ncbi:hypothetical protein DL93DRAFT_2093979 [Clavulina sp. PMI_390]|nr:hypothetical protein DL93DRAFT_2093979 [Clavulina sp. PMI_390]
MAPSLISLVIPFALASYLAVRGLKKRSLSPDGAAAAFIVGFWLMSVPLRVFGVTMIIFYLAASRAPLQATKVGHSLKKKLSEDGNEEAGYRNAWQVLCNSFSALVAGTIWSVLLYPDSLQATLIRPLYSAPLVDQTTFVSSWCPPSLFSSISHSVNVVPISRALIFAALGHFACCCGDTFASELGILSKSPPRLVIAPWKTVPPGTNGGMSVMGTLASLGGGILVGFTIAVDLWIERAGCLASSKPFGFQLLEFVVYGGLAGVVGSLTHHLWRIQIDSLLGAILQRSVFSKSSKMILKDGVVRPKTDDVVVSGLNILSNNQVNFVSSIVTACLLAALA